MPIAFCSYQEKTRDMGGLLMGQRNVSARARAVLMAE